MGVCKLTDTLDVQGPALPPSSPFELCAPQSWGSKKNLEMTGDLLFIDKL